MSKYHDAVERLDSDERASAMVDTVGGTQAMTTITESGLYHLIFTTRKPIAKTFRRWVTKEVIPSIRKTGSHSLEQTEQLPSRQLAAETADSIEHIWETLGYNNPRLTQILVDCAMNDIIYGKNAITAPLRGVFEIAQEMGFEVDLSSRSRLESFIESQGFTGTKEKRRCNGMTAEINCYEDTEELRAAIRQFFG